MDDAKKAKWILRKIARFLDGIWLEDLTVAEGKIVDLMVEIGHMVIETDEDGNEKAKIA